jgi:glycosyltransferase involved in cell wall biosynthesis
MAEAFALGAYWAVACVTPGLGSSSRDLNSQGASRVPRVALGRSLMLPMHPSAIRTRMLLRFDDFARRNKASVLPSAVGLLRAWIGRGSDLPNSLARYLVAAHPSAARSLLVRAALQTAGPHGNARQGEIRLARSAILKRCQSPAERGTLLVSFETELEKIVCSASFPRLEAEYQITFLPTWQPFYSGPLFRLARRASRPFFIMPSTRQDAALCRELSPLCEPLPFQASSWVAATYGQPQTNRDIDLLMLANFAGYKRHWRLFEAVAAMPPDMRVVVAGRPLGARTLASLRSDAAAFGVEGRVEFNEDPSDESVAGLLSRARVFCAMSHKEGSYIGVAEAMMAGAAVAMFSDALIGSREYINPLTGFLVSPRRPLAEQLLECLAMSRWMDPSSWARAHCSAEVNVARWNEIMRERARRIGRPWSVDIAAFSCQHFAFVVTDPEMRLELTAEEDRCARAFGIAFVGCS